MKAQIDAKVDLLGDENDQFIASIGDITVDFAWLPAAVDWVFMHPGVSGLTITENAFVLHRRKWVSLFG